MKKCKWFLWPLLASSVFLIRCGNDSAGSPLLQGRIAVDSLESLQIAYSLSGDVLEMAYEEITPAEDGSFSFDIELPEKTLDADIYVDNAIFGVHLEQGKTAVVEITRDDSGVVGIAFSGDNADLSRVYNACTRAFDIMKYFSPDPAEAKSPDEYRALLDSEYARLKQEIATLDEGAERTCYERLSRGKYEWSHLRILMDQAFDEGKKFNEYPEYTTILEKVDPNDPLNIRTGLIFSWIGCRQKTPVAEPGEDATDYTLESIDIVEREITDPAVRRSLANYIGYSFFTIGGGSGDVKRIWERFSVLAQP